MELEFSKLEFLGFFFSRLVLESSKLEFLAVNFFFFFFNLGQMNPRVNQVWETQFWVGTQVSKTIQLTK